MKKIINFLILSMVFYSCDFGELPVEEPEKGSINTQQINMGAAYMQQIWFDLGENRVVESNNKYDWELSFDCADTSNKVRLNSSLAMKAAISSTQNLSDEIELKDLKFYIDHSDGNPDSMALNNWPNTNNVAVIDLGIDDMGNSRGYIKIKVKLEGNTYVLSYCPLDNDEITEYIIAKDPTKNKINFSFSFGILDYLEPNKTIFDLVFTQYTYQFQEPYLAYLVSGVLINENRTKVAKLIDENFDEISLEMAQTAQYSTAPDAIGYDWKYYNLDEGIYSVNEKLSYLIQTQDGFYYKLRFISFYDEMGQTGFPTFEFQRL